MMLAFGLVMRVHFVSAWALGSGAFRVTTASVQQASQMIEIKGAPPGALSGASDVGEKFRAAFAASVGKSAASSVAQSVETPVLAKAPTVGDMSEDANASGGSVKSKPNSSRQAQSDQPVVAKLAVSASEGAPAKASVKSILSAVRTPVALIASVSATEAAPAEVSAERSSSIAVGSLTVSSEDAPIATLLQGSVPRPGAAAKTAVVTAAQSTVAGNGRIAANNVLADAPSVGVVNAKQLERLTGMSRSHASKADDVDASNYVASTVTEQTSQTSLNALSVGLAATSEPIASLTTASLIAVASPAAEHPRISERVTVPAFLAVPRIAEQGITAQPTALSAHNSTATASAGTADGNAGPAAMRNSVARDEVNALPPTSTVTASQAVELQARAAQAGRSAHRDRDIGAGGPVERVTHVATGPSLSAKTYLSNDGATVSSQRSTDVSERVPVSAAAPDTPSSGWIHKTAGLRVTVESKSASTETGAGIEPGKSEAESKRAPTIEAGSMESALHAGDTRPAPAQIDSLIPAPVAKKEFRPVELPHTRIALSQSMNGAAKDTSVKRSADDIDSASVVPQSISAKVGSTAAPILGADGSRDAVNSGAQIASVGVAAHPVAASVVVPVHAGGQAAATSTNPASAHAEVGLAAVLATQSSTATQSVEPHRTLLATPTALEVGVQSGTQGWLKIRAEVGGQGEVRASLDAMSSSGRDLLHSQLPALNAFLHGEQMPVTASVAERGVALDGTGAGGAAMGSGGGDGSAASNGSLLQGDDGYRQAGQQLSSAASETETNYDAQGGVRDSAGALSGLQAGTSAQSGRWLNVRV